MFATVLSTLAFWLDFKGKALVLGYSWSYFPSWTILMNNILSIILPSTLRPLDSK